MTPPTLSTSFLFLFLFLAVGAHSQPSKYPTTNGGSVSFKPSVAIIVAIFSLMFSITFLLLMYAKFCHNTQTNGNGNGNAFLLNGDPSNRTSSGIDKTVIESLPFFRFSALRGNRNGLECSVCLSKFDDTETLRLLPKCKHAFHSDCIDRWLGSHSTCPLCRHRIVPDDVAVYNCRSDSSRSLIFRDTRSDTTDLELFLERETDNGNDDDELLHKHRHRVRVSGAVFKGRWSDLNSADLVLLGSEMISSERHSGTDSVANEIATSPPRGVEDYSFSREVLLSKGNKCMSDITGVARFPKSREDDDDDKVRTIWLPIVRRTVRWFAGEERRITITNKETTIVSEV